jgi:hypothetical protein
VKTYLGHIIFYGDPKHVGFYKELFEFLGWRTTSAEAGSFGTTDGSKCTLFFEGASNGTRMTTMAPG